MKYLIAGLGNIGAEYHHTRHNVGFDVLDLLAEAENIQFTSARYASVAQYKYKGRIFVLIKPSTYMNLSGKAVKYWLDKEKLTPENLLVICDDLALPLGSLRLKAKGNDGGHNGLIDIAECLDTIEFPRLRIGIGSNFPKGRQVDYVLGSWDQEDMELLLPKLKESADIIRSMGTIGIERTMNYFNKRPKSNL